MGIKIDDNVNQIITAIENARTQSPISADNIDLLAASKSQPVAMIQQAISAGVKCFGENRVQEAQEKWQEVKRLYPEIRLHLIGGLQTNKVKQALSLFDVIQTLDRQSLLEELVRLRDKGASLEEKAFYVQVNTGAEVQKSGVLPENTDTFIAMCKKYELPVVGLMCVPPASQPSAPHFALLREIARRNGLEKLSMGMSNDFEVAVRMGSGCVRIGTALFGRRA